MPDFNSIPWTPDELIDFTFLLAATIMVTAFPVGYGLRARLRDPLAVSVILATSLTALAFVISVVLTLALHAGWSLPVAVATWVGRVLILGVGVGKVQLLWMLLRSVPRQPRRRAEVESVETT